MWNFFKNPALAPISVKLGIILVAYRYAPDMQTKFGIEIHRFIGDIDRNQAQLQTLLTIKSVLPIWMLGSQLYGGYLY
jgi:hypothetical protein